MTVDIDFVLLLRVAEIPRLRAVFPEDSFYVPPDETLVAEITRSDNGMFNLIHHGGMLKADFFLVKNDPLHRWALEHPLHARLHRLGSPFHRRERRAPCPRPQWAVCQLPDRS